jgi:hypothetical protein
MSSKRAIIHSFKINILGCHKRNTTHLVVLVAIKFRLQQAQLVCQMVLVVDSVLRRTAILSVQGRNNRDQMEWRLDTILRALSLGMRYIFVQFRYRDFESCAMSFFKQARK